MNRIAFLFLILSVLMFANPLLTGVINEFQTDIILGQKIEFHPINYGWEIPLVNTKVYAPGCSAFIDTPISNPPYGYTVIDSTILNGNIFLPLQTGYIYLYKSDYFIDEINYSDTLHSPILFIITSLIYQQIGILILRPPSEPKMMIIPAVL